MQFENNWVYPWPTDMYDPVLKVHLQYATGGPQPEADDVSFAIYYDPNIEVGRYSRPEKRGRYPLFVNLRERCSVLSTLCVSRFAKEPHPGHF
jgi:hypothetical protein